MSSDEPKKRQRVSVACMTCRAKRMRCDGRKPACEACLRKGTECEYQNYENKRRPPSKKYIESLHARIRQLESHMESLGDPSALTFMTPEVGNTDDLDEEADGACSASEDDQDPLTELTGLVGRLAVVDDGQLHYFGSQSSLNLPRQPLENSMPQIPRLRTETQGLAAAAQLGIIANIPIELQEHLLDLYWRWQNPWNYIVHKGAFLRSWRAQDDGRYCSPLLLSAIFAIAARYSDRIELRTVASDPSTAGNSFCEQAKVQLLYESEAPSVTSVQAAALLALRIMSDGKEALGWLYCGNATRMAHNLGLHVDCTEWVTTGLISEDEAEVRKVTWWGCFVVDKLFSCGLGRPSSIQKSGITCPKPTINRDDEYSPWLPTSNEVADEPVSLGAHSHISSTARYVSECMAIACEALEIIYAPNSQLSPGEIEGIVAKADVDLRAYYNTLPSYLRLPASPKIPSLPHIYLSHIQYHTHLILLHRPLIQRRRRRRSTKNSRSTQEEITNPEEMYIGHHMETCRHSATEISKMLRIYKQHYTLRQMPIAGVHLSFAAAVIHLIDSRPTNPDRSCAIRRLGTCIDTLQDLRTPWCAWADRSLRGVQMMSHNWYGCSISQLQGSDIDGDKCVSQEGPGFANAQESTSPDMIAVQLAMGSQDGVQLEETQDLFSGLFDLTTLQQDTNDTVRGWLAGSGYDLWNTTFDFTDSNAPFY